MCTYRRQFTTARRKQAGCLLSPEQIFVSSTRHEFNKVLETFHGVIVNFFGHICLLPLHFILMFHCWKETEGACSPLSLNYRCVSKKQPEMMLKHRRHFSYFPNLHACRYKNMHLQYHSFIYN